MADITKITSGTLIAAEKVEGTDVYNLQGEKLGLDYDPELLYVLRRADLYAQMLLPARFALPFAIAAILGVAASVRAVTCRRRS